MRKVKGSYCPKKANYLSGRHTGKGMDFNIGNLAPESINKDYIKLTLFLKISYQKNFRKAFLSLLSTISFSYLLPLLYHCDYIQSDPLTSIYYIIKILNVNLSFL